MSSRRNEFGALIINDALDPDDEMVISSSALYTNLLRIRVWERPRSSIVFLSPADEAALLAYLQERAGDRS